MLLMNYLQNYVLRVKQKIEIIKSFKMITKTNETKTLIKHISCNYNSKVDSGKCNSNPKWNNGACQC